MTSDDRFLVPLYSAAEAARHFDVPASTFRTWAHGYRNQPRGRPPVVGESIVTTVPADSGASIPFIGLAEAYALAAIRRAAVPLQRIGPALDRLRENWASSMSLRHESSSPMAPKSSTTTPRIMATPPRREALANLSSCVTTNESSTR